MTFFFNICFIKSVVIISYSFLKLYFYKIIIYSYLNNLLDDCFFTFTSVKIYSSSSTPTCRQCFGALCKILDYYIRPFEKKRNLGFINSMHTSINVVILKSCF